MARVRYLCTDTVFFLFTSTYIKLFHSYESTHQRFSKGLLGVPGHPLNLEVQKRGQKEKYAIYYYISRF